MKKPLLISILMIILGMAALTYQGIAHTTTEKTIDIGPLQIPAERSHTHQVLPIFGGMALVGGMVLFLASRRTA